MEHHPPEAGRPGPKSTPSHPHDRTGRDGAFCCDNPYDAYLVRQVFLPLEGGSFTGVAPNAIAGGESFTGGLTAQPLPQCRCTPGRPRQRDKYALTCLLHAPPGF